MGVWVLFCKDVAAQEPEMAKRDIGDLIEDLGVCTRPDVSPSLRSLLFKSFYFINLQSALEYLKENALSLKENSF